MSPALDAVREADGALREHMRRHAGSLLAAGSAASEEFDRLYLAWIGARWDAGDRWVRLVWPERPRP